MAVSDVPSNAIDMNQKMISVRDSPYLHTKRLIRDKILSILLFAIRLSRILPRNTENSLF